MTPSEKLRYEALNAKITLEELEEIADAFETLGNESLSERLNEIAGLIEKNIRNMQAAHSEYVDSLHAETMNNVGKTLKMLVENVKDDG